MNFRDRDRADDDYQLDITPLIDVVFQLLVFFMVTTSFSQTAGIQVSLPKGKSRDISHQQVELIVAITPEGQIIFKGKPVSLDQLRTSLTAIQKDSPDAQVIVQADSSVAHGHVVTVMDMAKTVGFERLAIGLEASN